MNFYARHPYEPSIYASSDETIMDKCTRCGNWTDVDTMKEVKPTQFIHYTQMLCQDCYAEDQEYIKENGHLSDTGN